jgi:magnesium transporter
MLNMPYFSVPITMVVRSRLPWLIMLFVAQMATSVVLKSNERELEAFSALAIFIPLLIGTGGNTGAQTVSTIIRAMSLGEVRWRDASRVLWKEFSTGLLMGAILSVAGFIRAIMVENDYHFGLVVGLTVWAICAWANLIASLIPLVAQRIKIDPALVSAPLITTLVDATGLAIYLLVAKMLLTQLH